MKPIIEKVDRELLMSELTADKKLRSTNKAGNELYIITATDAPNVMKEIGRLREEAFRFYGGGTGEEIDVDEFDIMPNSPYRQLIAWCPEKNEILGGYRFLCGQDVQLDENGKPILATSHLFNFSEKFVKEILPKTVELGRSFVALDYQCTRSQPKGLFVLDNLWDGLGALSVIDPDLEYYFGKVTMYNTYNPEARNMILYFLKKHFPDHDNLLEPISPLIVEIDHQKMEALFTEDDYKADYRILNQEVRKFGINIPPLISAYMSLTHTMRVFGTAVNEEFGDVEETGILVPIHNILEQKRIRHMESYYIEELQSIKLIRNKE